MEEMEKRLKKHVEVATRAQKSSIEQVQTQIDKLGEELAFDVNRIEKAYKLRFRARNIYGWSDWSPETSILAGDAPMTES